jgi:hypothetical protein
MDHHVPDCRQRIAHVVMQVLRNAAALIFLNGQELVLRLVKGLLHFDPVAQCPGVLYTNAEGHEQNFQ